MALTTEERRAIVRDALDEAAASPGAFIERKDWTFWRRGGFSAQITITTEADDPELLARRVALLDRYLHQAVRAADIESLQEHADDGLEDGGG